VRVERSDPIVEQIADGWSARKGRVAAHGRTRAEALKNLQDLLRLIQRVGAKSRNEGTSTLEAK
jgi:hypothetical protein